MLVPAPLTGASMDDAIVGPYMTPMLVHMWL
jgi:hypothetical protein